MRNSTTCSPVGDSTGAAVGWSRRSRSATARHAARRRIGRAVRRGLRPQDLDERGGAGADGPDRAVGGREVGALWPVIGVPQWVRARQPRTPTSRRAPGPSRQPLRRHGHRTSGARARPAVIGSCWMTDVNVNSNPASTASRPALTSRSRIDPGPSGRRHVPTLQPQAHCGPPIWARSVSGRDPSRNPRRSAPRCRVGTIRAQIRGLTAAASRVCRRRPSGSSRRARGRLAAASSTTTVTWGCSCSTDAGHIDVSGPSTARAIGAALPGPVATSKQVTGIEDGRQALRHDVPRDLVGRGEEAGVVPACRLRQRLDPRARPERRAGLVEPDVPIGPDAEQLQVDAAEVGEQPLVARARARRGPRPARPARTVDPAGGRPHPSAPGG